MHPLLAPLALSFLLATVDSKPTPFKHSHHKRRHHSARSPVNTTSSVTARGDAFYQENSYQIVDRWQGANFFDGWNFFSNADPTHGLVNYLDQGTAFDAGLAYVQANGVAVMKVDSNSDLPYGQPRNSVRISSQKSYDSGLFVLDVANAPYGCGVWPAFWTLGPNWPNNGEIDIFEGVHNGPTNQYTLHTAAGCTTDTSNTAPAGFQVLSAATKNVNCGPGNSNAGCAYVDTDPSTYGAPFNSQGGAVLVMLLNADGIKIWNFPRYAVPADLASSAPTPSSWPVSYLRAAWASTTCPTAQYFRQHSIVIDTTLCGDWAGSTYGSSGCPGTCQQQVMTGSNFQNAQWKINSVTVYQ